jgi:hypothetical protein
MQSDPEDTMQNGRSLESAHATSAKSRASTKQPQKKATLRVRQQTIARKPNVEELNLMIATAAYFCAERRRFQPGHELEDWLTAEREIRSLYG